VGAQTLRVPPAAPAVEFVAWVRAPTLRVLAAARRSQQLTEFGGGAIVAAPCGSDDASAARQFATSRALRVEGCAMAFDTRFQLIDSRATAALLDALAQGGPPPLSPLDGDPEASALWSRAATALRGEAPAVAARAACRVALVWNAAVLPAVVMRNVALTHRPLRMPDGLDAALDLPRASLQNLFVSAGWLSAVIEALPTRLDAGAETGAYVDATRAGPTLAGSLAAPSWAPSERPALARLLALLRAGERAGLGVWEALDTGPVVDSPAGTPAALCWPGLARPILAGPLSEEEWARLDDLGPPRSVARGDLEDLVIVASWVAAGDPTRATCAYRALVRAFGAHGGGLADDLLDRALRWLETTLVDPGSMGAGVIAYAHLEAAGAGRAAPRPLPAAAMARAVEVATAEDRSALRELFAARGVDGREALGAFSARFPCRTPDALTRELRDLFASHGREEALSPEIAESIAARWEDLFRAAPELARSRLLTDSILEDALPCALLLQRLEGPPSGALAALVHDLFGLAEGDRDSDGAFRSAVRARWEWLAGLSRASLLPRPEQRFLAREMTSTAQHHLLGELVPGDVPPALAARIAEQWHRLYRFAPESATGFASDLVQDSSAHALLLDRLATEEPCVALGRLVLELAETVAESAAMNAGRVKLAPFVDAARANEAALRRLAAAVRELGEGDLAERIGSVFAQLTG
jgi:hypothetical protein